MPDAVGETPSTVKALLECLVGAGGGAGMWVMEDHNPHSPDGFFNAGYFVTLGAQNALPILPEEMYFAVFQALKNVGHPFAPRVGYLDVGDDALAAAQGANNTKLLAAIAEGAVRGATVGEDGCDEATAQDFAVAVLDQALGPGAGEAWKKSGVQRSQCKNCCQGFDQEGLHLSICPAMGKTLLTSGDQVKLANLKSEQYNGRCGVLQTFNRQKERWVVRMGDKDALFNALNLEKVSEDAA